MEVPQGGHSIILSYGIQVPSILRKWMVMGLETLQSGESQPGAMISGLGLGSGAWTRPQPAMTKAASPPSRIIGSHFFTGHTSFFELVFYIVAWAMAIRQRFIGIHGIFQWDIV